MQEHCADAYMGTYTNLQKKSCNLQFCDLFLEQNHHSVAGEGKFLLIDDGSVVGK